MERKFDTATKLVDALIERITEENKDNPTAAEAGALHAYLTFAIEQLEKVVKAHDQDTDPQAKFYCLQIAAEDCRSLIKYFEKRCTE